jgi:ABC-type polysaccharide/polyol phosphate export permease
MTLNNNFLQTDEYSRSRDLEEARAVKKKRNAKAKSDLIQGLRMWRIWMALAWQDISIRYRRSVIGPLWITLSMAITVYSMGFLYARLFHIELNQYFPYLVSGMLCWTLIQSLITEGVDTFLIAGSLIRQVKLPLTFHIHRMCARNFIVSAHNVLVMVPIYLFFYHSKGLIWTLPILILNLVLVYINAIFITNILAMLCSRYRDMGQVIKSLLQVLFFLTPVMWDPSSLSVKFQRIILLNPLYEFIQLIRMPLMGQIPSLINYSMVLGFTLLGGYIHFWMFARYRSRIVYWL